MHTGIFQDRHGLAIPTGLFMACLWLSCALTERVSALFKGIKGSGVGVFAYEPVYLA